MSLGEEMRTWKPSTVLTFWGMVIGTWAGVSLTLGVRVWSWATGTPAPGSPIDLVGAIARGRLVATTGMWVCVGVVGALVLAVVLLPRLARVGGGRRERGDEAARRTGRRRDTRGINKKSVRAKAKRLVKTDIDAFGLPIGKAVNDRRSLWSSFEDVCTVIAGPRAGKTTCWVVSRILWAPGLVVATSNKRDVLDETRQARGRRGNVWVFDPQSIALEPQVFWWDILSYITDAPKALAATKALALSQIFIDTTRDSRAQTSAYFDRASKNLVAALLLAAARGRNKSLRDVYQWVTNPAGREPLVILRESGEEMMALALEEAMNLVAETRSGVYGGAATTLSFVFNEEALRWVTPQPPLPALDLRSMVRSTDTLYCLSQEGTGDAGPIVTALTVAVTEAAVDLARSQPDGRMPVPALIELDEAANVCRWGQLPNMYSHFGSRGILVDTILQSWAQGEGAWGKEGIMKIWSASNVKVYGGSDNENDYLAGLERIIGAYWQHSRQTTYSAGQGTSTTTGMDAQQRQIATVAELGALPAGRAWVLSSGNQPVLVATVPYWEQKQLSGQTSWVKRLFRGKSNTVAPHVVGDNVLTATAAVQAPPQPPAAASEVNPWVRAQRGR